jgi:hypothetical protein
MKQVTLHIPDTNFPFFMELAKTLQFVKKIEDTSAPTKKKVLQNVKEGLYEVALF